jgi:hypothetical protein
MKSSSLRHVACFLFAGCVAQHVASAQAVPNPASLLGGGLAEPAPPRPGDTLMTCKQIAREMGSIMRARNVRLDANATPSDLCNTARPAARMGAPNGAMLAQLGGAMRAMNDPRLMRLSQLAQEKNCANQEPDPTPTDECGSRSGPGNAAPLPDPFARAKPSKAPTPSAPNGAAKPKVATPAVAPPSPNTDPFRPR